MFTLAVLLLACSIDHMAAARLDKAAASLTTSDESEAQCPAGIPEFKQFSLSRKIQHKCGRSAWGTLYVGIISAHDLVQSDWTSASDPYARFRISDKHMREMRGFWAKNKPVAVTDDLLTEYKSNTDNPEWLKTFAFDFLCPQIPFAPNDAPMGPKPPIVIAHPRGTLLNKDKSGHQFQLELTIKDSDLNTDDSLGRVKIPVLDIMDGKHAGLHTFDLGEAENVQGTVDMLLWYCEVDDTTCEKEREEEWRSAGAPTRIAKRESFDCQMGCHTLLNPSRGRLSQYVNQAESKLKAAVGNADAVKRFEADERLYDSKSDAAALAAFASEHKNETMRLQQEWAKMEELEELADKQGEAALADREKNWAEAVSLAKQLAAFEGLGAQFCSAAPLLSEVLRWVATPLFNFVYDPKQNFLSGHYNDEQAGWLLKAFKALKGRMQQAETCLRTRWFDGQLLVNQWETTSKCHAYFNLPK